MKIRGFEVRACGPRPSRGSLAAVSRGLGPRTTPRASSKSERLRCFLARPPSIPSLARPLQRFRGPRDGSMSPACRERRIAPLLQLRSSLRNLQLDRRQDGSMSLGRRPREGRRPRSRDFVFPRREPHPSRPSHAHLRCDPGPG